MEPNMSTQEQLTFVFQTAVASIDSTFGEGYSKKNPQLIVALLKHINLEQHSRSTHKHTGVPDANIPNQREQSR